MRNFVVALFIITLTICSFCFGKLPTGYVVLMGGSSVPPIVFEWMVEHKPEGKFLLISYSGSIGQRWQKLLDLNQEIEVITPDQLNAKRISGVGAILIDGGDQFKYISHLDSKVLQKAHEKGIMIFGTSAGAMILGEFYFTAKNGTITSPEAIADRKSICIEHNFMNILCLKGALVDSHYTEREREGRLKVFIDCVKNQGCKTGIGIDESTALCIDPQGGMTVIGEGGVHMLTQDNSRTSLYPNDTSSYSHVCVR